MLKLKMFFILVAVFQCVFSTNCLDAENIDNFGAHQVGSPDEAEVKINWTPVWDDNEGNNEFVTRQLQEQDAKDIENCTAPNGLGLQNLFQEAGKILPKEEIKAILKSYSEDPQVKAINIFVTSPQAKKMIEAIRNSQEYQILRDYSCRILHIDLVKYAKLAGVFVKPLLTRNYAESHQGIQGLIDEINAVLPRQQLRGLYQQLLATDEELAKAVANLKSKEYHQLLLNVKNNVPEYKIMRQNLIDLGVPVGEMRDVLAHALGWAPELDLFV